jgi:hypothetical protein
LMTILFSSSVTPGASHAVPFQAAIERDPPTLDYALDFFVRQKPP